jgi:hypothetical protein
LVTEMPVLLEVVGQGESWKLKPPPGVVNDVR